jgi:ferrochelatase
MKRLKTAVVLFQLGGPDSPEAVEPFLFNLFMDPDIINFPFAFLARKPLARFISNKRSMKVRRNYNMIGGKSPILDLTQKQADALQKRLRSLDQNTTVFIAMRYWHPLTEETVRLIQSGHYEQILLIPLYPQFSQATTLSSLHEWNRQAKIAGLDIPTKFICCYPNHPMFVEALTDNVTSALQKFPGVAEKDIDILFSAHGVPESYIKKGDPYQIHVEETVRAILKLGDWNIRSTLCYQSKVGPMHWLRPSLLETVQRLAEEGRKHLLIVPVAFVTDHIETLHEINIDVREKALKAGVQQFELTQALNDHPKFIDCLEDLTLSLLSSDGCKTLCTDLWPQQTGRAKPVICPWK